MKMSRTIYHSFSAMFLLLLAFILTACSTQNIQETSGSQSTVTEQRTENQTSTAQDIESSEPEEDDLENAEETEVDSMWVTIGSTTFTATLADNSSAQALVELLQNGPLTIDMHDYANMEKVGPIGQSLPENNEQITTEPGDIILYLGDSLVIYYDTNSWNFTRIGKINDVTQEELLEAMGSGDVSVTFELEE